MQEIQSMRSDTLVFVEIISTRNEQYIHKIYPTLKSCI